MSKLGQLPTVGPGPGQMTHSTEVYDICPYNQSHVILRYRMQTHLHKCRQNYPLEDKVICEFNTTHHVPRKELAFHYQNCSSRQDFLKGMAHVNIETDKPIVPRYEIQLPEPEENWDDGAVGGYNPQAAAEKKCLIRGIHGAPPAERKDFKLRHRRHLQDLEAEAIEKGPIKSKEVAPPPTLVSEDEPLRLPKAPPQALLRLGRGAGMCMEPNVSKPSESSQPGAVAPNGNGWLGLGRGRSNGPAGAGRSNVPAPPPTNPWARGRPQF